MIRKLSLRYRKRLSFLPLSAWLTLTISSAAAESDGVNLLTDWNINGFNTYRMDVYEESGDISASPYPNRGFQQYDDFTINMNREFSIYENIRIQLNGTIDDSEYRTQQEGLIIERGYFTWEKADVSAPFRLEVGDYFGNQSLRTLQRALKGVQLELQPAPFGGQKHSFQVFTGITNQNYRSLSEPKDIYTGASWLIPETALGAVSFTAVNNINQQTDTTPQQTQTVYSMAWGKEAELYQQELQIEAEYALFSGDVSTAATDQNKNDNGFFTQLQGRSRNIPLTYRVRHERYGDDFRPDGSSVTSNQRSYEGHVGWRFDNGLNLRGRVQTFRTNWKSDNPTDRDVLGVSLSGPIIPSLQINGNMNSFVANLENKDKTTDALSHTSNVSFTMPIIDNWVARLGGFYSETDNRANGQSNVRRQVSFGVDYDFTVMGFRGAISPAMVLRDNQTDGSVTQSDIAPAMSLYLTKGTHILSFSHNTLSQDTNTLNGIDTDTHQSALNYAYTKDAHRFELIANYFDRNPTPGDDTEAYRIGFSWTYNFDRPARPVVQPVAQPQALADTTVPVVDQSAITSRPDLMELAPGMTMEAVTARLANAGLVEPLERSGLNIYETQYIEEVDHRQRLGLLHSGGFLDTSVLVIEFDDLGDIDTTELIYNEVRKIMFDRYGVPINRVEEGSFSNNLLTDLRTGRFIRYDEWQTSSGVLRFGIPYRTDGQVRMELIHSRSFPPGENNFWSIEQLR